MRAGVAQVARCMKTLMPRPLHTSLWHEDPKVTLKQLVSSDGPCWPLLGSEEKVLAGVDGTCRRATQVSFAPAGAGQVAKFEDLIEEASAELDRVEAQLQTASQEKVVLQTGNAQLMRQAQESAAVKAQASHNGAVVVWLDTGTVAVSSCCCCRQAIAHPKLLARNMPLHC